MLAPAQLRGPGVRLAEHPEGPLRGPLGLLDQARAALLEGAQARDPPFPPERRRFQELLDGDHPVGQVAPRACCSPAASRAESSPASGPCDEGAWPRTGSPRTTEARRGRRRARRRRGPSGFRRPCPRSPAPGRSRWRPAGGGSSLAGRGQRRERGSRVRTRGRATGSARRPVRARRRAQVEARGGAPRRSVLGVGRRRATGRASSANPRGSWRLPHPGTVPRSSAARWSRCWRWTGRRTVARFGSALLKVVFPVEVNGCSRRAQTRGDRERPEDEAAPCESRARDRSKFLHVIPPTCSSGVVPSGFPGGLLLQRGIPSAAYTPRGNATSREPATTVMRAERRKSEMFEAIGICRWLDAGTGHCSLCSTDVRRVEEHRWPEDVAAIKSKLIAGKRERYQDFRLRFWFFPTDVPSRNCLDLCPERPPRAVVLVTVSARRPFLNWGNQNEPVECRRRHAGLDAGGAGRSSKGAAAGSQRPALPDRPTTASPGRAGIVKHGFMAHRGFVG